MRAMMRGLTAFFITILCSITITKAFTFDSIASSRNYAKTSRNNQRSILNQSFQHRHGSFFSPRTNARNDSTTRLFGLFGKVFEESGPLGKGITVGKVQVALQANDRSGSSIFSILENKARTTGNSNAALSRMCNDVCLSLLRKSDDWTGACSTSTWFGGKDSGGAEKRYNELANQEASKFEKEYIPKAGSEEKSGGPTYVIVSLIIELQGDSTNFDGAGFSFQGTKDVLSSIASDCTVDGGYCVNAVEVFWTPSERKEVLSKEDALIDFPELIDL